MGSLELLERKFIPLVLDIFEVVEVSCDQV